MVGLRDHGDGDDQAAPEAGDECGGEVVGSIAAVERGDQGGGVGNRPQFPKSGSAKIRRR
jgi:hypothetical protein